MANARKPPTASIRTLYGIAKSDELRLTQEELYAIVYRETGKEHMRELTQGEINEVARVLQNMRDAVTPTQRTDKSGNPKTTPRRRKIYALCGVLGWNDDKNRINGFCKKMCGVECVEWLTDAQCDKVIEGLKKMAARKTSDEKEKAPSLPQEEQGFWKESASSKLIITCSLCGKTCCGSGFCYCPYCGKPMNGKEQSNAKKTQT